MWEGKAEIMDGKDLPKDDHPPQRPQGRDVSGSVSAGMSVGVPVGLSVEEPLGVSQTVSKCVSELMNVCMLEYRHCGLGRLCVSLPTSGPV